jgi:predicted MFS family arabinose efflux permease
VTARFGAGRALVGSVLVGALGVLLVPVAGGPPAAAALVLLVGHSLVRSTEQLYAINYTSAIQGRTPDQLQGRVNAAVRVLTAGAAPVGALLGGLLAEAVGLRATAVVAGLGVVVAFVWIARSPVRGLRSLSGDAPITGAGSGREEAAAPPAAPVDPPAPREPVSEAV